MAKTKKRIAESENQMSLFDLLSKETKDLTPPNEGSANIHEQTRQIISNALRHLTKSRWQIAGEMSHLLGEEISVHQLNSWAAPSKSHRMPFEYAAAFCLATDNHELLSVSAKAAGMFLLPGSGALRCEIQKYDEQVRRAQAEKKRRMALLEALENKKT
jgi:hypothetical protein